MSKDYSFSSKNFIEYLDETKQTVMKFQNNPLDKSLADKCAEKLWHLTDYYFREKSKESGFKTLKDYQKDLRTKYKCFAAINDICDSTKHSGIDRKANLKESKIKEGAFSPAFSRGFDISGLIVVFPDDAEVYYEDLVVEALQYWEGIVDGK